MFSYFYYDHYYGLDFKLLIEYKNGMKRVKKKVNKNV